MFTMTSPSIKVNSGSSTDQGSFISCEFCMWSQQWSGQHYLVKQKGGGGCQLALFSQNSYTIKTGAFSVVQQWMDYTTSLSIELGLVPGTGTTVFEERVDDLIQCLQLI